MKTGNAPRPSAEILALGYTLPSRDTTMIDLPPGFGLKQWPGHLCPSPGAALVDPKVLRRGGRVHKLALAAAHLALRVALPPPVFSDQTAVSVGTGHAAHQESMLFIENMIKLDEREPKPTRFINSVHNSLAAQIAISFGCKGENHTFVHGPLAFESALWQALQILRAGRAPSVLVCGADELTPYLLGIGLSCGWWERKETSVSQAHHDQAVCDIALPGEGAAAFLIGKSVHSSNTLPKIAALRMKSSDGAPANQIDVAGHAAMALDAITEADLEREEIQLVLLGSNGDAQIDSFHERLMNHLSLALPNASFGAYKRLYGEFFTAPALGLALATASVRDGRMVAEIERIGEKTPPTVSNALLYNFTRGGSYSVCVVKR